MTVTILVAATFCVVVSFIHIASIAIAIGGFARPARRQPQHYPHVSLIRPVCGIDNYAEETLRSTFDLDYPHYEILFCVASADDPVAAAGAQPDRREPGAAAKAPDRRRPRQHQSQAQ